MATIQLLNGTQLNQAKICEIYPSKPKIWPESIFIAHLQLAHDPEQPRQCWKCGQMKAAREFPNHVISKCKSCGVTG